MAYVAIYRKFRPQTFSQVKGQESIVRTLQNQIRNNRIGHAYLFTGTRGTGKTSVARIFAKAINCLSPADGEPCNTCENCKAISAGNFMDVVEIDAASNTGVDDIRRVIEEVQYTPVTGRYKVYIIDEAHMLSSAASNAFLKTLEEPPEYAVFILATTEPHKLPVTILSRCQRYDFTRITTEKIAENIFTYLKQEHLEAEERAVSYIARVGDGSMRDSLSLLDKVIAFNLGKKLTYEDTLAALGTVDTEEFSKLFRLILKADAPGAVAAFDEEVGKGKDISRFINDFVWYLRNLLLIGAGNQNAGEMLGLSDENLKILHEDAGLAQAEILMRYIRILSDLMNQLRFSSAKQVLADVAIIKLARPQMETDPASLLDRLRQIEMKMEGLQYDAPRYELPPEPVWQEAVYEEPPYEEMFPAPEIVSEAPQPAQESISKAPQPVQEPATQILSGTPAQTVCQNWGRVLAESTSPLLKVYLKDARPEAADETTVCILPGSKMAETRLESKTGEIREIINRIFGTDITVHIGGNGPSAGAASAPFAAGDVAVSGRPKPAEEGNREAKLEALLEKNIKMHIEMEDI